MQLTETAAAQPKIDQLTVVVPAHLDIWYGQSLRLEGNLNGVDGWNDLEAEDEPQIRVSHVLGERVLLGRHGAPPEFLIVPRPAEHEGERLTEQDLLSARAAGLVRTRQPLLGPAVQRSEH